MIDLIDIHTHSIASGHAYSTITENIMQAKKLGLKYYGLSDHGPKMPGCSSRSFFRNFKRIPQDWQGMRFLGGCELNILDPEGKIDLDLDTLNKLDYCIASLHANCYKPGSNEENTQAYLNALNNPHIQIIGHPDDGRFAFDKTALVVSTKLHHKLLEVNNASLAPNPSRIASKDNLAEILRLCIKHSQPVIMGSDAHYFLDVGNHSSAIAFLEAMDFPNELIVNYHEELIKEYLLAKD